MLVTALGPKSGSTVSALVNGVPTTVQVARDLTPEAGDVLVVTGVGAQWFALARVFPGPTAIPDTLDGGVAPPSTAPAAGTLTVAPVETASYVVGSGWRLDTSDTLQGTAAGGTHQGAAFYGLMPRSLAGATVTDARVQLLRLAGGAVGFQATTLRLVTESTRPAVAPTLFAGEWAGPSWAVGQTGSFPVPASWAQAMVDGAAGGLAITGAAYVRLAGRATWAPAWSLSIDWRR